MFEYLPLYLSKYNHEIHNLRDKIESLKNDLSNNENSQSLMSMKLQDFSLSNHALISEKDTRIQLAQKCQIITKKWAHSHLKPSKINHNQIPNQCEKIIGGNFEEATVILKKIETEPSFPTQSELLTSIKLNL